MAQNFKLTLPEVLIKRFRLHSRNEKVWTRKKAERRKAKNEMTVNFDDEWLPINNVKPAYKLRIDLC